VMDFFRTAALDVEADGAHARAVEFLQFLIRNGLRHLRDSDKRRAKDFQCVEQIRLIERLERPGHHRTAAEIDRFQALQIVLAGKRIGHESLVGHDGKCFVDDVKMTIEIFLVQRILLTGTGRLKVQRSKFKVAP
jgi:hypothetical protein